MLILDFLKFGLLESKDSKGFERIRKDSKGFERFRKDSENLEPHFDWKIPPATSDRLFNLVKLFDLYHRNQPEISGTNCPLQSFTVGGTKRLKQLK